MYTGKYMYTIRPEDIGRRHSILRNHTNKYNNILEPLGTVLENEQSAIGVDNGNHRSIISTRWGVIPDE